MAARGGAPPRDLYDVFDYAIVENRRSIACEIVKSHFINMIMLLVWSFKVLTNLQAMQTFKEKALMIYLWILIDLSMYAAPIAISILLIPCMSVRLFVCQAMLSAVMTVVGIGITIWGAVLINEESF